MDSRRSTSRRVGTAVIRAQLLAVAGVLGACSIAPVAPRPVEPSPASSVAGSEWTIAASPRPTPAPAATPSAAATPIPAQLLELHRRLPLWAGGEPMHQVEVDLGWLTDGNPRNVYAVMLSKLGRSVDAFAAAGGGGSHADSIKVIDMEVDGVPPDRLESAFIEASSDTYPGTKVSARRVGDLEVIRARTTESGTVIDVHVFTLDTLVFAIFAPPSRQPEVDQTVLWMQRPRIDDLLPATIGGRPVIRGMAPAAAAPEQGCAVVCAGEVEAFAKAAGAPLDAVDFGFGVVQTSPRLLLLAFRVDDGKSRDLVTVRVAMDKPAFGSHTSTFEGKTITSVERTTFPGRGPVEWLYQYRDVLIVSLAEDPNGLSSPESDAATAEIFRDLP
jgi:hypothetical protein